MELKLSTGTNLPLTFMCVKLTPFLIRRWNRNLSSFSKIQSASKDVPSNILYWESTIGLRGLMFSWWWRFKSLSPECDTINTRHYNLKMKVAWSSETLESYIITWCHWCDWVQTGRLKFDFFDTMSIPVLEPIQPPFQWVPRALSLGVKRPGRESNHSPPSRAEVEECVDLYLHCPIRLHGMVLS
jgi:hypothetical protein